MKLLLQPKDVKLTLQQEEYIYEKLGDDLTKYLRHFSEIDQATVRVRSGARWGFWLSYSIILPKRHHIYIEKKDADFWKAVVIVKRHAEREIRKYKERVTDYNNNND